MLDDGNGNLTGDGVASYAYDALGRLVAAPAAGASYAYDPLGRRQAKTVNGVTTQYLGDGAQEIGEYDGAGLLLRSLHSSILSREGASGKPSAVQST